MAPGPSLALMLDAVDVSRLAAEDAYELTAALTRMVAHYEARLLVAMYDTALCAHEPAGSMTRAADVKDHCADQLAWELHLSSSYAFSQVLLGRALVRRLPMVLADFQPGTSTRPAPRCSWTACPASTTRPPTASPTGTWSRPAR
jgi:hypothetical protein